MTLRYFLRPEPSRLTGAASAARRAHLVALALASALAACSSPADEPEGVGQDELSSTSLEVKAKNSLPIAEVSGLGRRVISGSPSYLAIGDSDATVVTFNISASGSVSSIVAHDLSPLFGPDTPQWEAVAGDGAGRVFVLSEAGDRVAVLDRGLGKIVHEIALSLAGSPLEDDWSKDPNSRGEGFALLANGHLLVVKEKDPVALVEFGPPEDFAEGYFSELALGNGSFSLPPGASSEFVALHHWELKDGDKNRVPDVSDITIDATGRPLLLSDQGRSIVSIERLLDPSEDRIDLKSIANLPSSVDKPEGLTLDSQGHPFVAIDTPSPGKTLFRVSSLP